LGVCLVIKLVLDGPFGACRHGLSKTHGQRKVLNYVPIL